MLREEKQCQNGELFRSNPSTKYWTPRSKTNAIGSGTIKMLTENLVRFSYIHPYFAIFIESPWGSSTSCKILQKATGLSKRLQDSSKDSSIILKSRRSVINFKESSQILSITRGSLNSGACFKLDNIFPLANFEAFCM